jgi:hypothetical protein
MTLITIIKIMIDRRIRPGVVSAPFPNIIGTQPSKVITLEGEDEHMSKRMLISGHVRNKTQQQAGSASTDKDTVIVQVQLVGPDKERFLAYKRSAEFEPSNAEAGKKLMLERLAQVEAAA